MTAPRPTRREALGVGLLAGLGLADLLALRAHAQAAAPRATPRAKGVIHLVLPGGLAHQESFDPKPYAPAAYRGAVRAIGTSLDGLQVSRHLPKLAQVAHQLCVVRSMSHRDAAHERGAHSMLTGYAPSPALVYPSLGSVVAHQLGGQRALPPYVCVPNVPDPYAGNGYLSTSFAPFALGSDPARRGYGVRDLTAPKGVDEARGQRRRALRGIVDARFADEARAADGPAAMTTFYERAYELLDSAEARAAFDIDAEPGKLRDRYGRNEAGQRLLLARRLVAAGARYVTVSAGGWDHHQAIERNIGRGLPPVDQALAALLQDLDASGLLDEVLVLVTTEFGRTPKVNPDGGRDHWPGAFSIVMAGGGVRRGLVYGRTDATATAVEEDAVHPEDLARTVFTLLGIDPDTELLAGARPVRLVKGGRVLDGLLA
ncbi:MAG: DUF1501 domain-containing protein [Planctomycetota bacterium]